MTDEIAGIDRPTVARGATAGMRVGRALDRLVAVVSPGRGIARMRDRARFEAASMILGSGGYEGARRDRAATKNWNPRADGPIGSLSPDLPALRYRGRDLERNSPLARSVTNTYGARVVGTGLWPRARLDREFLGLSDDEATALERRIDRYFWTIAQSGALDFESRLSWTQICRLVLRAWQTGGDVFVVRRYREVAGETIGTRLQLIEADRVSNPPERMLSTTFADGIERDANGLPVAIHVRDDHPGETGGFPGGKWTRVPVVDPQLRDRQVLHIYDPTRIGQLRGEPLLAPVIEYVKQLKRFNDAELQAAVLNAFFTAIVKTKSGEEGFAPVEQSMGVAPAAATAAATPSDIELGSGTVAYLARDEDIAFADPRRPNPNADGFVRAFCAYIGAAVGIPREVLLKEFTASYSAARAALLDMWSSVLEKRTTLTDLFCQPVYEWVLDELVDRGLLDLPGFRDDAVRRAAWCECEWHGPTMGQIDPVDEVEAAARRVELGVSTLAEETALLTGGDWEVKHVQRVKEQRMRARDGLDAEGVAQRTRVETVEPDGDLEVPAPRRSIPPEPEQRRRLRGDARDRLERLTGGAR